MFSIFSENSVMKKRTEQLVYFDHQNVNFFFLLYFIYLYDEHLDYYVLSTVLRKSVFTLCSGSHMMKNFSVMQRLHLFVAFEYGLARAIIFQVTVNSVFQSFREQMCLLNSVTFLLFSFLNEAVWFRNLVLNWFAVSPMYVSFPMGL